jgi:hypothetical protein
MSPAAKHLFMVRDKKEKKLLDVAQLPSCAQEHDKIFKQWWHFSPPG